MIESKGRIMGIDYGSVRIGIAMSDESQTIAFGREVIANDNKLLKELSELVKENSVSEIVIGYPLSLKGEVTDSAKAVEEFKEKLESHFVNSQITISLFDERFTSKMATDSMLQSGMKKKKRQDKSNIDVISASIMLQSYLDLHKKN